MKWSWLAIVVGATAVGVVLDGLLADSGPGVGLENLVDGVLGLIAGMLTARRWYVDG